MDTDQTLPRVLALLLAINAGFRPSIHMPEAAELADELRVLLEERKAA